MKLVFLQRTKLGSVELGKVCKILNGFPFKSTLFTKSEGYPVIRIRDLSTGRTETFFNGEVPSDFIVDNGDLLVGMDGNFRCVEWQGGQAGLNQRVCKISPDERFMPRKFLLFGLNGYLQAIQNATSSVTVGHLSSRDLALIPFPLPPVLEQHRIVAKLEEVLGRVASSKQRLSRIPALLKRFRQSVLAAACSGKLTADWRESRGLAQEFESVALDEVTDYLGGFAYRSPTFTSDGKHQVIRIGNVRPMRLEVSSSPVFISNSIAKETERFRLRVNDIVVSMTGTKYKRDYGYAAIVHEEDGSLYLNQRVSRIRCGSKLVPRFLLYWMHSDLFRNHFFAGETGNVNQGNVGADGIRKAPIEIPSITEQHEIVKRVEQLFTFSDQIEARFKKAQAQVDRLTQSVLAKAFRGELVPTEAELARREKRSFESASELLARIEMTKTERSAGSTAKRRRIKIQP